MVELSEFFEDPKACPVPELFSKVKFPWELVNAKDRFVDAASASGSISPSAKIAKETVVKGKVLIGKNTLVGPYVVIEGPAVIGSNCEIRSSAWIRPKTIIGDDCVIGHGVELKNALLFNEAKIGTNAFVGDSVLGKGARVGSGVILGNRRFDQKAIEIKIGNAKYQTGSDKFGAVVGDYSRLGANALTSPGTVVGKHTWIYGGCSVSGFIPKNSMVKLRQQIDIINKEPQELGKTDAKGKR